MEFVENFLTEIILSILMFVIGLTLTLIKKFYNKNKSASILRFKNSKEKNFLCFTANSGHYDENELVTLGYVFEYMGVGELRSFFRTIYKDMNMVVKMTPEKYEKVSRRDLHQDLILIGGPFHNVITANLVMYNPDRKLPFSFDDDASLIYDNGEERKVFSPSLSKGENQYYETDYALLLNIENPLKKGKRILAFMGCRSIGCYGVAYYITHYLKNLKKSLGKGDYAVVVKVSGDEEDIIDEPEVVFHCTL